MKQIDSNIGDDVGTRGFQYLPWRSALSPMDNWFPILVLILTQCRKINACGIQLLSICSPWFVGPYEGLIISGCSCKYFVAPTKLK